ncbi:hypothetical protein JW926_15315 [Candidatus Sumerlaeota bacterium]|nr:hypothetical protein [Candidatus Sumerlaeota bacterium]
MRNMVVIRWLVLLKLSDLMLDTFAGFIALYFVDIVSVSMAKASLAVLIATGAGIAGNIIVIYILKRLSGLAYVFWSAVSEIFLFSAFLLIPGFYFKVAFLIIIVMANAGWYPVLKAQLYKAMPGKSGTVMTLGSLTNIIAGMIPLALGIVADRWGLKVTLWILLLAPVSLIAGIPKQKNIDITSTNSETETTG